jgi:hypothetical protein
MRMRRLRLALPAVALGGCGLALAGCGGSGSSGSISLSRLPLVAGATVVAQQAQCDPGSSAFCAVEAVIVDRGFGSSGALLAAERHRLRSLGWSDTAGDNGKEQAAESPGRKVRVTYATAQGDLLGWDERWIDRPWPIVLTLARTMYQRTAAMSVMLEAGSA